MACNTTHVDETTPIAPDAELDDGAISLVYTKGKGGCGTKLDLLDGFLKLDSADHVHKASFHVVKCAAFRLTPAAAGAGRGGGPPPWPRRRCGILGRAAWKRGSAQDQLYHRL